jgi:pimeloyl-ACP methyl ester carboxylesterase
MSEHDHVDGVYPFPAVMQTRTIETNGTSIHVRVGGHGPAVVMLHGFGTTGDMWGSSGERTRRRPHGCRARPAWVRPLVEA